MSIGIQIDPTGLREVIRRKMFVTDQCGLFTICDEAVRLEPWSEEAQAAERELSV